MISRTRAVLFLGLILVSLVLAGCGAPAQVGDKPEDRFNPALTAHQKAVLSGHKNSPDN
ncbi:MAG: hypothetical protein ACHQ50_02905 [Fimbriimonadales bacterium]